MNRSTPQSAWGELDLVLGMKRIKETSISSGPSHSNMCVCVSAKERDPCSGYRGKASIGFRYALHVAKNVRT